MDLQANLSTLGLTDAEAEIYLALLQIGKGTVKEIAWECKFHRTNIYDILDQLEQKGVASSHKEESVSQYKPIAPGDLDNLIDKKRKALHDALPDLKELYSTESEEVEVEVYKGREGMKTVFNTMLREADRVMYGLNIKGQLREMMPDYAKAFYRDWKSQEQDIIYKGIYTREYDPDLTHQGEAEIRYIDEAYQTPVATHIYGDNVSIELWQPSLIALQIQSGEVAETYKDYFHLLWTQAQENPSKH